MGGETGGSEVRTSRMAERARLGEGREGFSERGVGVCRVFLVGRPRVGATDRWCVSGTAEYVKYVSPHDYVV